MTEIAVHFGVYPNARGLSVLEHRDADDEFPFTFDVLGPLEAYVTGSWACWGPADQDTDGDTSLHVLVLTDRPWTHDLARAMYEALQQNVRGDVLPYAWVTTQEDWAETLSIATFAGGHTCLAAITGPSAMVVHA